MQPPTFRPGPRMWYPASPVPAPKDDCRLTAQDRPLLGIYRVDQESQSCKLGFLHGYQEQRATEKNCSRPDGVKAAHTIPVNPVLKRQQKGSASWTTWRTSLSTLNDRDYAAGYARGVAARREEMRPQPAKSSPKRQKATRALSRDVAFEASTLEDVL